MLQDFSDSFKAYLYDRTTSPLFGAFAASWSVWNYKLILTILSDWSVDKKIAFIQNVLFRDDLAQPFYVNYFCHSLNLFIFPLISAVVILLAYPLPSRWLYAKWKNHQVKMHDTKLELEKVQLVPNDVHEKLREEYFTLKTKLQNEIRAKDKEIEFLQKSSNESSTVNSVEVENSSNEEENADKSIQENLHNEYIFKDENAKILFKAIANSDGESIEKYLTRNDKLNELGKTKGNYYLDQFENDNIIRRSGSDYVYLTERGRVVAVEQGFV